jgi:uronate dehydrogenase
MPESAIRHTASAEARASAVTHRDLSHLFDCCLNGVPEVSFAIVNGISANRHPRLDVEATKRLVGYQPQADVFALAAVQTSSGT